MSAANTTDDNYEHTERCDGIRVCFIPDAGGLTGKIHGWRDDHSKFKQGDRLLLISSKGQASRYRVDLYEPCGDPADMYFLHVSFAPRRKTPGKLV